MKFEYWFDNYLKIDRFPVPTDIENKPFDCILNVSDEYIESVHLVAKRLNKDYFWFPMSEDTNDIGIHSIYGALQILYKAEQKKQRVLLHCHGGANRSQTVADAYYFMRTKTHRPRKARLGINAGQKLRTDNRLMDNINDSCLPGIHRMEKFLIRLAETFKKDDSMRGGGLTGALLHTRI